MKHFWQGFQSSDARGIQFKRHTVLLYVKGDGDGVRQKLKRLSQRYPSVQVKIIDGEKEAAKAARHNVRHFPTVLLLKDGREVDRASSADTALLTEFFRKAHV